VPGEGSDVGRLHLLVDLGAPVSVVEQAVRGGVDVVHLRDHAASASDLLTRGRELRRALGDAAHLIVNDRVDVALALGADGVQLGRRALPPAEVRRFAPSLSIGASIHSVDEATIDADWLMLGTIFASNSHPGEAGAGISLIQQVAAVARVPIVVIGGIDAERAGPCIAAGARGVAVISAILRATDPCAAAARLREELERT
jgi:thiamine-phosphate pyrophosphorylase